MGAAAVAAPRGQLESADCRAVGISCACIARGRAQRLIALLWGGEATSIARLIAPDAVILGSASWREVAILRSLLRWAQVLAGLTHGRVERANHGHANTADRGACVAFVRINVHDGEGDLGVHVVCLYMDWCFYVD